LFEVHDNSAGYQLQTAGVKASVIVPQESSSGSLKEFVIFCGYCQCFEFPSVLWHCLFVITNQPDL